MRWVTYDDHPPYFCVASSNGTGSGRFLASSLRDALDGGARLLTIRDSQDIPDGSSSAVDFVFASDDPTTDELIRVGTDESGGVMCTQLIRCPKVLGGERNDSGPLQLALQGGEAVAAVRWAPKRGAQRHLELVIRTDDHITLAVAG